jgi:hypothetical protein
MFLFTNKHAETVAMGGQCVDESGFGKGTFTRLEQEKLDAPKLQAEHKVAVTASPT